MACHLWYAIHSLWHRMETFFYWCSTVIILIPLSDANLVVNHCPPHPYPRPYLPSLPPYFIVIILFLLLLTPTLSQECHKSCRPLMRESSEDEHWQRYHSSSRQHAMISNPVSLSHLCSKCVSLFLWFPQHQMST